MKDQVPTKGRLVIELDMDESGFCIECLGGIEMPAGRSLMVLAALEGFCSEMFEVTRDAMPLDSEMREEAAMIRARCMEIGRRQYYRQSQRIVADSADVPEKGGDRA